MYCKKCGHLLNEGDKFCPKCGSKVETQPNIMGGNDFVPPFRRSTDVTDDLQESRPKRNFQFEEFNWDLDGYPSEGRAKKTEDIDFNWESVMDERNRKRREEGVGEIPSFLEKKEEQVKNEPQSVEPDLNKAENADVPEPEKEKTLEEEIFGDAGLNDGILSQTRIVDDHTDLGKTTKIDKFYTYNKKNEEFQALLDQEYNRLKTQPDGEEADEPDYKEEAAKIIEEDIPQNEKNADVVEEAPVPEVQVVRAAHDSIPEYVGVVIPETPANIIAFDQEPSEKIEVPEEKAEAEPIPAEEPAMDKDAEKGEEVAAAAEPEKSAEPVDNKLTFEDVFADDEEEPEREKPKKYTGLKVLAVILCIIFIAIIVVICIKTLAPTSVASVKIQEIYSNLAGRIGSIFR